MSHYVASVRRLVLAGVLLPAAVHTWAAAADFETPEYRAQEGLALINASQAYALGYTGLGVTVGVLDSGMDGRHREFVGQIVGGYDLVLNRPVGPGDGIDVDGHGSHVGGIIAGRRDGVGMHGVAFDAKLISVRMNEGFDNPDDGIAPGWNLLAGYRLPIISSSLGYNDCYPTIDPPCNITDYTRQDAEDIHPGTVQALHNAARSGALMVFATGNETQPHPDFLAGLPHLYPELKPSWIAVNAVDLDGNGTWYGNHCGVAKEWCLAAPGGEDALGVNSVQANGTYIRMEGTSMATPHVAGAAAVVKQRYPYFTAYHLQQTLLTTATDIGAPGVDDVYGWGLLNLGKAVLGPAQFVADFAVDTQGYDSTFANNISGVGGLVKSGAGVLTLTGANTYAGATRIDGGKLVVNGSLASDVTVQTGGALGGIGTVAMLTQFGTVTPGNSVGTLTVTGNYLSKAGSTYQVEAAPDGTSDRIKVNGAATLEGGSVAVLPQDGLYAARTRYTILTAQSGLNGRYDAVSSALAFLMPSLDYDPGTVYLTLDRVSFGNAATSANQRALTSLLDPRVDNPPAALVPVYDALFDATNAQAPVYLNQLSGDALAAFPAIAQDDARGFTHGLRARALGQPTMPLATLSNRVQLAFAGEGLNGLLAQASGTASAEPTGAAARPGDWKGWVSVAGTRNRARGNGNGAGFSADAAALQAGFEKSFDAHARIGAALGYTDTRADADDSRNASGKVKSVSAGVYGGYDTGRWFANAALAYSSQGVDTRRNLAFMGSTATASYTANTWSAWSEVGPHLGYGRVSIDPSLSLSVMQTRQPEYAESGSPAALRVDGTTYNSRRIGAGVRLSAQEHALAATVKPDVSIRYEREVGDTGLNLTQQLSGLGSYTVRSTELGRDIVTLGVGLTTQVKRELTLFGRIDAAWRKNQNAQALQVGLQYRW